MKIYVEKIITDPECEKDFYVQSRGYQSCCDAMDEYVNTLIRVSTYHSNGETKPNVTFKQYDAPRDKQIVCPFCGAEHTVEIINTVVLNEN
jgi:hypothetical protein